MFQRRASFKLGIGLHYSLKRIVQYVGEGCNVARASQAMDLASNGTEQVGMDYQSGVLQYRGLDQTREVIGCPGATILGWK